MEKSSFLDIVNHVKALAKNRATENIQDVNCVWRGGPFISTTLSLFVFLIKTLAQKTGGNATAIVSVLFPKAKHKTIKALYGYRG